MHRLTILGAGGRTGVVAAPAWTPADESSLVAWWDMSTPASYNTTTRVWTPRFGSGSFAAPGAGPTKITTGFSAGNKDALRFVGTSDTQLSMSNPGVAGMVCVVVMRYTTFGAGIIPAVYSRLTGNAKGAILARDTGVASVRYGSAGANAADDSGGGTNVDRMYIARHTLAARTIRTNGAETGSNTTLNTTDAPTNEELILGHYSGVSLNWTNEVAVFALFTTAAWTTPILEKIEGYIAHQGLGISAATLPGGHTYKASAP